MVSPRPDPADSSFMTVYNQRFFTGFDKNTSVVRSNSEEFSEGTLGYIRSQIIDGLPSSHDAHRTILLSVHSDIVGFMTGQFGETINPDATLGSVITLSGSALYAQAMTCESYVQFHWGLQGLGILKLLQDAMNNPGQVRTPSNSMLSSLFDVNQLIWIIPKDGPGYGYSGQQRAEFFYLRIP